MTGRKGECRSGQVTPGPDQQSCISTAAGAACAERPPASGGKHTAGSQWCTPCLETHVMIAMLLLTPYGLLAGCMVRPVGMCVVLPCSVYLLHAAEWRHVNDAQSGSCLSRQLSGVNDA